MRADAPATFIDEWFGKLAKQVGVDRITLWELSADGETFYPRHSHSTPARAADPAAIPASQFRWLTDRYRSGRRVAWARVPDDIPPAAAAEREHASRSGAKSLLCIPITAGAVLYVIVFASLRVSRTWPRALVQRLKLFGDIFAGAALRQRIEAALHASEARNRAMLRALPDVLFVMSPDGVYLDYYSRDPSQLLVPPDRFLGRCVEEVVPAEVAGLIRGGLQRASKSGELVQFEHGWQCQDSLHEFEVRMVRRDDGAIVIIARNITERNQSARRLRESETRFGGAFDHSRIGIALVSPEGRWLQVNAANCEMLGYSETELLEMRFQALTHPDDLSQNIQCLQRALAGEIEHYELEKRYIHKDGHIIPALLTVSVVRDVQRRPLYFVSQLQDLTERYKAQSEIERLRLELSHSGRLAAMGQLTASLAHQLMQPITAILADAGAGQRLLAAGRQDAAEMRPILDDVVASCNRAADVIDNVRSLLRKDPKPHHRVNLNRLVREVIDVTRGDFLLRKVQLVTQLDPLLSEVDCNPIQLQQVILNILLNGAEALVGNEPSRRLLEIATAQRKDGVEISVRDWGPGVDPTDLKRIFDPFFTTKPDGMGMGLAICAEVIRAHNGRLWAANNPDGGLTLHCELPLPNG